MSQLLLCMYVCCSLTLNSEDGVAPGALCSLSQLKTLQELRLGDVDGNNPNDINTICDLVSRLTSLHMGYCPRLQVSRRWPAHCMCLWRTNDLCSVINMHRVSVPASMVVSQEEIDCRHRSPITSAA